MGLLGLDTTGGLLGVPRMNSGIGAAAAAGQALLAQPRPVAPVARQRVNPLRVLDNFLFDGNGIGSAADQERARLDAIANAPALADQQARLAEIARNMGPAAELAFATNKEKFGENLAEQYAPQVIAEGNIQSVIGSGQQVQNFRRREFGDSIVRDTPTGVETLATRGPTIAEQTAQDRLAWDQEYGTGQLGVARQNADSTRMNAETTQAGAGFTLSPGQQRRGVNGEVIASAPTGSAANPDQARAAIDSNIAMVTNTRGAIARAAGQTGFFSTGTLTSALPFNQSRANLEATLDTVKGNLSFTELAKMRANSPTGGALGSIAVRELDLLGSTVASLDSNQSQEELERSLKIIDESLARYEAALNEAKATGQMGGSPSDGAVSREAAIAELRRRGLIP